MTEDSIKSKNITCIHTYVVTYMQIVCLTAIYIYCMLIRTYVRMLIIHDYTVRDIKKLTFRTLLFRSTIVVRCIA